MGMTTKNAFMQRNNCLQNPSQCSGKHMSLGTEKPKLASDCSSITERFVEEHKVSCSSSQGEVLASRSQRALLQQSLIPGYLPLPDFKAGFLGDLSQGSSISSDICPSDISLLLFVPSVLTALQWCLGSPTLS